MRELHLSLRGGEHTLMTLPLQNPSGKGEKAKHGWPTILAVPWMHLEPPWKKLNPETEELSSTSLQVLNPVQGQVSQQQAPRRTSQLHQNPSSLGVISTILKNSFSLYSIPDFSSPLLEDYTFSSAAVLCQKLSQTYLPVTWKQSQDNWPTISFRKNTGKKKSVHGTPCAQLQF